MSKILYVEACGGASGDMLAGGMLDLGWPVEELSGYLQAMGLDHVTVSVATQEHQGIMTHRLDVQAPHEHAHRHLSHILELLERLPGQVAQPAAKVFRRLAQAEAKVHGTTAEEVHFHEVGAADAIADVVAFCAGLAWLGGPRLVASPLPMGEGFVNCAHGKLPLPAPAVLQLLEGVPVYSCGVKGETVTPTGAAILTALAESFGPAPAMRLEKSGTGGGSRPSQAIPNMLRLWLGQEQGHAGIDQVVEIVCHLDDMNPEDLPLVIERLMAAGALDAAAAPLVMKKGRLGQSLTVMSSPDKSEALAALVLEQTPSLGVRLRSVERRVLEREVITVESPWGSAKVKRARTAQGWRLHPEAEDVARICRETGLPPWRVRHELEALAGEDR
ncbi:MAG: nickel pincer cofactor biosynthesis protein LarC [Desulfarculaceae bacterium]|nr:nickel pincer cofactor biosynthesis protein LarC [Desulfarculaceae bacterium]MCF8046415.1 nickel pincer cofactor biosynthesis protein LarC [Desulfarculaceae bacterium]MCF8066334.1 nickel pincer cofactor biosynthesis protein LarC [Desulfarculaceae bacterium]MCF8099329.1 nickel pincer cofactor biosynthesis protein LarC [Desulfarculaceae bacterium]MCF8123764.1 nickel pincer cofactor biosynthesis protein LarC [Desulfarculaceae bacterium]